MFKKENKKKRFYKKHQKRKDGIRSVFSFLIGVKILFSVLDKMIDHRERFRAGNGLLRIEVFLFISPDNV